MFYRGRDGEESKAKMEEVFDIEGLPSYLPKEEQKVTPLEKLKRRRITHLKIDIDVKDIQITYATPDGRFLSVLGDRKVHIYSLQSQKPIAVYQANVNYWLGIRTLNGTDDSKYILFQSKKGQISQWSTKLKKIVATYHSDKESDGQSPFLDIVLNTNSQFWACTERNACLWNLDYKCLITRIVHPERNYIYLMMA